MSECVPFFLLLSSLLQERNRASSSISLSISKNQTLDLLQLFRALCYCKAMCKDQLLLILLLLFLHSSFSMAVENIRCTTSCGEVANISYPFRVRGDPVGCGDHKYEVACTNNSIILDWNSGQYYVRSINYADNTISVVDVRLQKHNCSYLPLRSVPYYLDGYYCSGCVITIVGCTKAVDSMLYIDASSCLDGLQFSNFSSSKRRRYAMINANVSSVETGCTVEFTAIIPWLADVNGLRSYAQIYERRVQAFELEWSITEKESLAEIIRDCLLTIAFSIGGGSLSGIGVTCELLHLPCGVLMGPFPEPMLMLFAPVVACMVVKFILGAPCVMIFLIRKWRRRHLAMDQNIEEFLQSNNNFLPIRYSYSDIKKITGGLRDKLGEGGYGSVFKGRLRSGREVAVKILKKGKTNGQDFISEVATIGRIHHVNVVGLVGYCFDGSKQALVYDFMHNGSLDRHIFSREKGNSLACKEVYEIALGVIRGIEYLHRGCDVQILHFDIKPHNILLDRDFTPKVSDFGLAKLYPTNYNSVALTAARGTLGYMAPELVYKNLGSISYKADVYSFGKLLMEMACGRKHGDVVTVSSQTYFPQWIHNQLSQGADIPMEQVREEDKRIVKKMIIVALWCIQWNPANRPSMRKVLEMLEREVNDLQIPPKPLFYTMDTSTGEDGIEIEEGSGIISASSTSAITYEDSHLGYTSFSIAQV